MIHFQLVDGSMPCQLHHESPAHVLLVSLDLSHRTVRFLEQSCWNPRRPLLQDVHFSGVVAMQQETEVWQPYVASRQEYFPSEGAIYVEHSSEDEDKTQADGAENCSNKKHQSKTLIHNMKAQKCIVNSFGGSSTEMKAITPGS